MLDEKDLQAIKYLMKDEIKNVQNEITELRESLEEVRDATNYLVEWVDKIEKMVDTAI